MAYLGKSPSQGVRNRYYFTASGSETSISGALTGGTLTFTDGNYVDVNLNGVTLVAGTDYNTSTANTIAGLSALTASDVVEIVVYDVFSVFSGNVNSDFSVGGNLSVTGTTAFTGATTITGLTTTGNINFGDNGRAIFGAGSDLQIYHDGSDSYINDTGTGNLRLAGSSQVDIISSGGEFMAKFIADGAATLYHNNASKLATTATGVDVTGALSINSFGDPSNNYITLRPNFAPSASGGVGFAAKDHDGANNDGLGVFGHDGVSFTTGGSERMRLDSSGNLLVGTTNATGDGGGLELRGNTENGGFVQIKKTSSGSSGNKFMNFARDGSVIGSVSMNGTTAVAYNTSSDYRLKENVTADWDATTRLKQLNPVRFNFIADADTTVDGFLAHEVQSVIPEAITGTKDEVDADGNPVMQGIDQSKLVPLLVKTIIELEARIAALEA